MVVNGLTMVVIGLSMSTVVDGLTMSMVVDGLTIGCKHRSAIYKPTNSQA